MVGFCLWVGGEGCNQGRWCGGGGVGRGGVGVGVVVAECAYFCLRTIICMFQLRCLECHQGWGWLTWHARFAFWTEREREWVSEVSVFLFIAISVHVRVSELAMAPIAGWSQERVSFHMLGCSVFTVAMGCSDTCLQTPSTGHPFNHCRI